MNDRIRYNFIIAINSIAFLILFIAIFFALDKIEANSFIYGLSVMGAGSLWALFHYKIKDSKTRDND